MRARLLTPKLLVRGFEFFVLASLAGFAVTFVYGNDLGGSVRALTHLEWEWLLVGVALASMDWFGGGLRLWVLARHVMPNPPLKGMFVAGGMGAWGSYVTPLQSGAAPMLMYTMRRYGVPLPVGVTCTFLSFVATVAFFAIAGWLAILAGAGRSLGQKGNVLGLSLYDLFLGTLWIIGGIGVVMGLILAFPRATSSLLHWIAEAIGRRSRRVGDRLERLRTGIDEAHDSLAAFNSPRGWLALVWATLLSGPSHANRLLAGYVALRALGIHTNFVDVLLVQTLVMFLLYFAPTPGASGIAEVLSAAVMSVYVPRGMVPIYTLVWRFIQSWLTIAVGFVVFSAWVRRGLRSIDASRVEDEERMVEVVG
jgi:glycosyltransferase 2 family protein